MHLFLLDYRFSFSLYMYVSLIINYVHVAMYLLLIIMIQKHCDAVTKCHTDHLILLRMVSFLRTDLDLHFYLSHV